MKILNYTFSLYLMIVVIPAFGQSHRSFDPKEWIIRSSEGTISTLTDTIFKNRSSLKLDGRKSAIALRKDVELTNFKMELDIAGEVMSGIGFRVANEQNYEFIYFRPGYGGTQEAIQYVPVFNGALSWVFYNYPTFETTADLQQLEWFHVTLEVKGDRLKVYVDHDPEPQMDVMLLHGKLTNGNILLRSMFGTSYFANIEIEDIPETDKNPSEKKSGNTFLTHWKISEQQPASNGNTLETYIPQLQKVGSWKDINEKDNYVNFSRYFEHPNGVVVAKHKIISERTQDKTLVFDFIGKILILLNNKPIFHYEKYKLERVFDGTLKTLLHLEEGENDLVIISEGDAFFFGKGFESSGRYQHQNWGFIAKIEDGR